MKDKCISAEVSVVTVNRAEVILPAPSLSAFLSESLDNGFVRRVDQYEDVFLIIPWTAKKESLVDQVKLIFEFSGEGHDFCAWLKNSAIRLGVEYQHVCVAKRGAIRARQTPDLNPGKWPNKQWPVTKDYPSNLAGAFPFLHSERIGSTCLEVNCPLSTDDLGQMCSDLLESFPLMRLVEISQGVEHAIDPAAGKEMNFATARLLFDISALPENDYLSIFTRIESIHSFIVPVMRIFTEPPEGKLKRIQWGL